MTRAYTIALDGSTYHGSVAIIRDARVVAERTLGAEAGGGKGEAGGKNGAGRGDALMPAIAQCLKETGIKREEIARIVCGSGPGSFTSLRVAGSIAKGLAVGYGVDLYAVSSILLTVTGARPGLPPGEYLSVLDAMRGEYFAARVTLHPDQTATQAEPAVLMGAAELAEMGERESLIHVVGPGQRLDFRPHARGVAPLLESVAREGPVDLASWEPIYGRLAEAQVRWETAHGRPLLG
ncbi:MAG TPA: tRNA (adenosine(37)-N6)-threonylcarbamoyltransferase complex dimerization subunit type 1 TsaB [Gemmatimonadaceae bacterium]|nr:tRNA (adenosine(37)-N6)-threonylcarbamoyltransferase complex dimerization subunit type 1 TsaB [Gemmatimonadaceae bacterium]